MQSGAVIFEGLEAEVPMVVEMVEMVMVKTQPAQGPAQLLYPSYVQAPTMLGCSELSKFVRIRKLPHATKRTERSSTRGSFSITDGAKFAVARL